MKHILPVLTITTLAAAASAQSAAASSGLSYDRVSFSRASQQNTISAQTLVGGAVVIGIDISGSQAGGTNHEPQLSLGYVFKNVIGGADLTVSAVQPQWEDTLYGVTARRSLNEIFAGLEATVSYVSTFNSDHDSYFTSNGASARAEGAFAYELAYNINKQFQVAVARVQFQETTSGEESQWVVSGRFNF